MQDKAKKKKKAKNAKLPVKQREYEVGDKKPPKEHQFKPGQSGNPAGPPKRRTQLWGYFCKFQSMTKAELKKLDKGKMSLAQLAALRLAENMEKGKHSGSEHLARHVFDREEGRAVEHVIIGNEDPLTDQDCEEIRQTLIKNAN